MDMWNRLDDRAVVVGVAAAAAAVEEEDTGDIPDGAAWGALAHSVGIAGIEACLEAAAAAEGHGH